MSTAGQTNPLGGPRPLYVIADEIRADWPALRRDPQRPYATHPAWPYVDAMLSLNTVRDRYGMDNADMIVRYFLSNATQWRGPVARRVKDELRGMLK